MFKKNRCQNCGEKVSDNYNFCPYCRAPINRENREDWGMLGRDDFIPENEIKMPFGFNAIFNNLMKNLNKQFSNMDEEIKKQAKNPKMKKSGVSISISTANGKPPQIKVKRFGNDANNQVKSEKPKKLSQQFSDTQGKKFSKLPKKEPSTNLRRLSDKVIYEIKIPGVKSLNDVSITQLENSIEIKAITKDKAYSKLIPVKLPVKKYDLSKGTLILELDAKD